MLGISNWAEGLIMHGLFWMLRKIMRVPAPKVAADQALQIAIAEAVRRGHGPSSRPTIHEHIHIWAIRLDPKLVHPRIVEVDNQTGQIVNYLVPPR
jgi:hypothetical protein